MKQRSSKILIFVAFLSFPTNAGNTLVRPGIFTLPRQLFQIASKTPHSLILALYSLRKKISLEEFHPFGYQPIQLIDPKENTLLNSRVKNFPWKEYERLQQAYENDHKLTFSEFARWVNLLREYNFLEGTPGFEQPAQINSIQIPQKIPGMRMAGCGASCEIGAKSAQQKSEKPELIDERQKEIDTAIRQSEVSGFLDLSRINFTTAQLQQLLDSLPPGIVVGIHTLDVGYCELEGTLPSLTRFENLRELQASDNRLTEFSKLPPSLEKITISCNRFSNTTDITYLTSLTQIKANFNQFSEFPMDWYQHLGRDSVPRTLELEGNLLGNLPEFHHPNIELHIPNSPVLMHATKTDSLLDISLLRFSTEFPSEILRDRLYLGGITHMEMSILKSIGVGTVFNCANDEDVMKQSRKLQESCKSITVQDLKFADNPQQQFELKALANQINTAAQKHTVLINCRQGVSRSATLTIAYLMLHHEQDLLGAIELVRRARPCIRPNPNFMRQLVDLEMELRPSTNRSDLIEDIKHIFDLQTEAHQS